MMEKRTDYLSWDEYFMGVAVLSSLRSKDPNTQVGACIVNQDKKSSESDTTVSRSAATTIRCRGTGKEIGSRPNTRTYVTPS